MRFLTLKTASSGKVLMNGRILKETNRLLPGGLSLPLPRLFVTLNNLYLLILIYRGRRAREKGEQSYSKLGTCRHAQFQHVQLYISTDKTRVFQIKIDSE